MPTRAALCLLILAAISRCDAGARPEPAPLMMLEVVERRASHVIVISIDGLRPDAIERAPAKHLQALIERGAYCATAKTVSPTVTLPGHVSMLSGLDVGRHGVTANEELPGFFMAPTVFTAAKNMNLRTGIFFSKSKLRYLARPGAVDVAYGTAIVTVEPDAATTAAALARVFAERWAERSFDFAFVHLREPDEAGHKEGWMTEAYLRGVAEADAAVGSILETVRASERVAVIVTADHGGTGLTHADDPVIPWICVGPGVTPGLKIGREIRTFDTAATALLWLGLRPHHIDGRPVEEVFK